MPLQPTSALDPASEAVVSEALGKLCASSTKMTTITVAHRLMTIVDSDIIFVMARGRIVEQGTHDQLLDLDVVYAKLFEQQTGIKKAKAPQALLPELSKTLFEIEV